MLHREREKKEEGITTRMQSHCNLISFCFIAAFNLSKTQLINITLNRDENETIYNLQQYNIYAAMNEVAVG